MKCMCPCTHIEGKTIRQLARKHGWKVKECYHSEPLGCQFSGIVVFTAERLLFSGDFAARPFAYDRTLTEIAKIIVEEQQ